jgi:GT2 family glycosyltransferase
VTIRPAVPDLGSVRSKRGPKISAVILTCDRPAELAGTLRDLDKQTRSIDQFVVVNNSADEAPTRSVIKRFGEGVRAQVVYLRASPVYGTASGRNAGMSECIGDIIFLIDDDVAFPDSSYVDMVCRVFENDLDLRVGAVTTLAESMESGSVARRARHALRRLGKGIFGMDSLQPGAVTRSGLQVAMPVGRVMDVDWLQGGVSAIRKQVARAVWFDVGLERVPLALSEDVDFGLQIRRRWRIVCLGTVYAVNAHRSRGGTARQWLSDSMRYELIVRNYDRINRRHREGRGARSAYWWAMYGVGLERLVALVVQPRRAWPAWKGYVHGVECVLRGADRVVVPPRRVQRMLMGDNLNGS